MEKSLCVKSRSQGFWKNIVKVEKVT